MARMRRDIATLTLGDLRDPETQEWYPVLATAGAWLVIAPLHGGGMAHG